MRIYHGGYCPVENPEIRPSRLNKDFGQGFYCTEFQEQAERWARRYDTPVVNVYEYTVSAEIDVFHFPTMTEEWLDFIADCRSGKPHNHEIVEGAMANDQVWNFIGDLVRGALTRKQFWVLAEFKYPTHQIVFCSEKSLVCLEYIESYEVEK
jgi:hypothetical protein